MHLTEGRVAWCVWGQLSGCYSPTDNRAGATRWKHRGFSLLSYKHRKGEGQNEICRVRTEAISTSSRLVYRYRKRYRCVFAHIYTLRALSAERKRNHALYYHYDIIFLLFSITRLRFSHVDPSGAIHSFQSLRASPLCRRISLYSFYCPHTLKGSPPVVLLLKTVLLWMLTGLLMGQCRFLWHAARQRMYLGMYVGLTLELGTGVHIEAACIFPNGHSHFSLLRAPLKMWLWHFFPQELGVLVPLSTGSGQVCVQVMLHDVWGYDIKSHTGPTWFSWDSCSWNLATLPRGCPPGP